MDAVQVGKLGAPLFGHGNLAATVCEVSRVNPSMTPIIINSQTSMPNSLCIQNPPNATFLLHAHIPHIGTQYQIVAQQKKDHGWDVVMV